MKKFKNKSLWKKVGAGCLAGALCIGAVAGIGALASKAEETTKEINPVYAIGGLTEQGQYLETKESIYTKDAFKCQGLDVEIAFDNNISYRIFFYDSENDLIGKTSFLTNNYDETTTPFNASTARVVITPKDDSNVSWYEKNGYAKQLTITVNKEQSVKEDLDITDKFTWQDGVALVVDTSIENYGILNPTIKFKTSDKVDISMYHGAKLSVTVPIFTSSTGGNPTYGCLFYDVDGNKIDDTATRINSGESSVETIVFVIPENAKYFQTTYWADTVIDYEYNGNFMAQILM